MRGGVQLDPQLFLPEPEPRQVSYTVISVDDHLVEPAQAWGHLPSGELRAICCENAARLYRHPPPERVLPE
jgi:hypothetical protein